MIKKIDILGIQLDDYTVREAIRRVEAFPEDNAPKVIESISMKMIMETEHDPVLREVLSSLDLAVIGEKEILEVAGAKTMQRMKETEENDFFFEFFKRIERNRKRLFLLGETEEKNEKFKQWLMEEYPKVLIEGEYALENCVGDLEAVINDLNAATPDIVVSILPTPKQEYFFAEHRDKINTKIWYGLGEFEGKKKYGVKRMLRNLFHRGRLKSSMEKYEKRMSENRT